MTSARNSQHDLPILVPQNHSPGVLTLTLNRPNQYNALSEDMLAALQRVLDEIAGRDDLKVLILAANGKAFCAGHDLKQMRAHPDKHYYESLFATCSQMMLTLTKIPQIVIAKVHGMATAAGCQLVANADLAIASQDARFAVSGVNLGLFCSTPSVPLSRNVSRKRAFEMLVTGDFIDAPTAVDYGLVNQSVPAENLDSAVDQLAQNIAGKPAQALRAGKALFYQQLNLGLADAYQIAGETMACNMLFEDAVEGIDAFIEKRAPDWR